MCNTVNTMANITDCVTHLISKSTADGLTLIYQNIHNRMSKSASIKSAQLSV